MKQRVSVTVEADLLAKAKAFGINLSQALETVLRASVREEEAQRWQEENSHAIDSFNRYIDKHGTIGDRMKARQRAHAFAEEPTRFEEPTDKDG